MDTDSPACPYTLNNILKVSTFIKNENFINNPNC